MRSLLVLIMFLTVTITGKAQSVERIYSFINNELPAQEFGKSSWGIFLLEHLVILDSGNCNKLLQDDLKNVPKNIQKELYNNCMALSYEWQHKFRWEQTKIKHDIIVTDVKHKLSPSIIKQIKWAKQGIQKAKYWIKEWNQTKIDERLVNYSSIPVFSDDQQYVLIFRGQDVKSEGGWDTIYIYRKEGNIWIIAEKLIVSEI
ncbi:MAG: hypothetical protein ABI261_08745 [Ginsengibacter sp.]